MRAYVVIDLGFGDAGKGLVTDFLVRHFNSGAVVRYNGGAQAAHNVVTPDGRHHTFSQFGSGTFVPGVKTYLSKYVVIHPGALLVEGDLLKAKGVPDVFSRLRVSDQALVITPFHQAANRIREMLRGENRHGSCGVGVGEAVEDSLSSIDNCVRAGDLTNPSTLRRKLRFIREQKRAQLVELGKDKLSTDSFAREWEIFEREDVIDTWLESISRISELGLVVSDSVLQHWFRESETVIFEGAQGVLLDADKGFHPFTTWSNCTAANADEIIATMAPDSEIFKIGVLRSYAVRHGSGPLPTETPDLAAIVFDHNKFNEWQGRVRYGWFDSVLARYALDVTGGVDALAITHLDLLSQIKRWKFCVGYSTSDGLLTSLHHLPTLSLAQRTRFTQALDAVTPMLESCDADEEQVIQKIESLTGQPVGIISRDPSAKNVQSLNSLPL